MKFYSYKTNEQSEVMLGVESPNDNSKLLPLTQFGYTTNIMAEFIGNTTAEALLDLKNIISNSSGASNVSDFKSVKKIDTVACAPIIHPAQDVICLGVNYVEHAKESAKFKKEAFGGARPFPIYFSKRVSEAVADGGEIPAYVGLVDSLDYESELAVIIGKDAKNISEEEAFDYIFGYTIVNDVSARNLQTRHSQWYLGKSLDGFTPMGPCIVTKDEFDIPPKVAVRSYVNGELRQNSNSELLITGIAHIIAELSSGITLKAGTIIYTGTPSGVGMGFVPPRFLKPGDVVVCEIEGIGEIKNMVMTEY